jgi:hypothetical protein
MTKLTARWVSGGKYQNAVAVGDLDNHARFVFTNPPQTAKKVIVHAKEEVRDLDGKIIPPRAIPGVQGGPTKAFHGYIESSKFIATKLVSGKISGNRNNEFRLTGPEGKNTIGCSSRSAT